MLWHDEDIGDGKSLKIIVQKQKIGIVARPQSMAHGAKCAIKYLKSKLVFLTFQFVLFIADAAEEVCYRSIALKLINLRISTVRTKEPVAYPTLGPYTGALRTAFVSNLSFVKFQFHSLSAAAHGRSRLRCATFGRNGKHRGVYR